MTLTSWPNQPAVPSTVRDWLGYPQLRNDQTNPTLQTPEVFIHSRSLGEAGETSETAFPYLVYRRSHSAAVDKEPYPQGYTVPSFQLFDGTSDPKEHLARFESQCGDTAANWKLLLRQFPSSLTKTAFTWYTNGAPGSVSSWELISYLFCKGFHAIKKSVTIEDLRRCRQERKTKFSDSISRFRTLAHQRQSPLEKRAMLPFEARGFKWVRYRVLNPASSRVSKDPELDEAEP